MTEEIKAGQIIEYDKDSTPHFIIDGVDVSGCKYFQIEANIIYPKAHYCGSTFNRFCEDDENCVYKQLKRLEQENAKLKDLLETRCYNEVEFENKKLKQALEEIRKLNSSCSDCDCYNACGACSNAEEKPYRSFKIADEVLKDE